MPPRSSWVNWACMMWGTYWMRLLTLPLESISERRTDYRYRGGDPPLTVELLYQAVDYPHRKIVESVLIRDLEPKRTIVIVLCEYFIVLFVSFRWTICYLSDEQKFTRISQDPTNKLKAKVNRLIDSANAVIGDVRFSKVIGDFPPGYAYENVKTHKEGNPLRPIISQVNAPTYKLAKRLKGNCSPSEITVFWKILIFERGHFVLFETL